MGASKASRLAILTATDDDFTSADQGNADPRYRAWINDAARLAQVIHEDYQTRTPTAPFLKAKPLGSSLLYGGDPIDCPTKDAPDSLNMRIKLPCINITYR